MTTCHRPELLRALKLATGVCGEPKMPILANVALRATGLGKLEILATDLVASIRALVPCSIGDELAVMHDASKLHQLVAAATADEISIDVGESSWSEIKSGRMKAKIAGQPLTNFPTIPSPTGAASTVETAVLKEMIDRTWFAASDDDARPNFCGVHLSSDGVRATAISTDSHRMCRLSRALGLPAMGAIIPRSESLKSFLNSAPTCQLSWTRDHLFVAIEGTTIALRLVDLAYPVDTVTSIIEMPRPNRIEMNRTDVLASMAKAAVMIAKEVPTTAMIFRSGVAGIRVINKDLGEVVDEIDATYDGPDITIGFNPSYVIQLLKSMSSDRVILDLGSPLDPALWRQAGADDYCGIIMPMRV